MALTFDVYQPREDNGAAVIYINSGGWVSWVPNFYERSSDGFRLLTDEEITAIDPILTQISFRPLLDEGFTVFSVRHGSSPKFEMAEIVEDLRRAIRFIRFHAEEYGVDKERVGLWGLSAGGHLSLLLGTTAEVGLPDVTAEFERSQGRLAAMVAYFSPTDLRRVVESSSRDLRKEFPALALGEDGYNEFSPIHFVSPDDPPTLIIHGDQDKLVPIIEGESMHQALRKSGIESEFVVVKGAEHGFYDEDAERATKHMVSWFKEHLGVP